MKYDDLVSEAEDRAHGWPEECYEDGVADLFRRLAAAIRDLQQHVPPEGWGVTEYTREDGARPEVTREAVAEYFRSSGRTDWNIGHVNAVMLAISHFAPPPAPLPPIYGMSMEEIETEIVREFDTGRAGCGGDILTAEEGRMSEHAARVAHRLAQPALVVDPINPGREGCAYCMFRWERRCARFPTPQPAVNPDDWCGEFRRAVAAAKDRGE